MPHPTPGSSPADPLYDDALRALRRRRGLRMHTCAYVLNSVLLIAVWAVTEYSNSGGWPERISEDGQPGNWNPWIVSALIGTAAIVGLRTWLLYGRRPISDADVRAEADRLRRST